MKGRSVIVSGGIAYGTKSQSAFYNSANEGSTPSDVTTLTQNSQGDWAYWGDNNLDPVAYAADIEACGVLNAAIETKARMAIGRGFLPFILTDVQPDGTEVVKYVNDPEILKWLELNEDFLHGWKNIRNLVGYGWGSTQCVMSKDKKTINRIKATDVYQARLKKFNKKNQIESLFLYGDWTKAITKDQLVTLPILEEGNELEDLQNRAGSAGEFVVLHRMLTNGRMYYPRPLWMSAKAWVDLTKSIPALKNKLNQRQIFIKFLIIISPQYWTKFHDDWDDYTPEKKEQIMMEKYDEIDEFLTGTDNAGKTITAGCYVDPVTKEVIPDIQITAIDDKMADGKYLPDSAAADKQILFSMFLNPAIWGGNLLGDGASGGAGSGSDIREAAAVQLVLMHAERMLNLKVFNLVKYYNGWYDKYKDEGMLVFRYQNSILTTLDTGKSAQNLNL
jgi:hypothetical protein